MMDERRRHHLHTELKLSMHPDSNWFTAQLFRLIAKADGANRARLAEGFPDEVEVYNEWMMYDGPGGVLAHELEKSE